MSFKLCRNHQVLWGSRCSLKQIGAKLLWPLRGHPTIKQTKRGSLVHRLMFKIDKVDDGFITFNVGQLRIEPMSVLTL